MKPDRIPSTDSIEELARFWDTHDLTEFEDQLEEVSEPVFERGESATLPIKLSRDDRRVLERIARDQGVKETTLLRRWVRDRLRKSS